MGNVCCCCCCGGDYERRNKENLDGNETIPLSKKSIADYENNINNELWYFGTITRLETEMNYLTPAVEDGAFLIRKSSSPDSPFVLSVKCFQTNSPVHVFHYKINFDGEMFFISEEFGLRSLVQLVEVYSENKLLITKLGKPCKKKHYKRQYELSPKYSLNWEIPREELDVDEKVLGKGNFGLVHLGLWQKSIQVAVKKIAAAKNFDKELFFKEVEIMKKIRHNNIICLYGMCTQEEPYLIINEIASNGNLKSHIQDNPFSLINCMNFAIEIADGMDYLSERNIVHRDLACRNILLDENFSVKISDFGLSRQLIDGEYVSMSAGTWPIRWYSIEALVDNSFTTKSDVWSFGILIHEMFNNCERPYKGINSYDLLQYLNSGQRMKKPDNMSEDLYRICLSCWDGHPNRRPTFNSLREEISFLKSSLQVYEFE